MISPATKPETAPTGPAGLEAFVQHYPQTPHLAIGGITPRNIGVLVEAGVRGVAVSRAVCAADDPDRVVAALREAIEGAPSGYAVSHGPDHDRVGG